MLVASEHSQAIQKLLKNMEDGVKQNLLIYGQKGLGRKSSVYKAVFDYGQPILCVTVSAYLHSTESSIIAAIENQLRPFAKSNMRLDNLDAYFNQFQDQKGIVLIIDDIDALAQKRQVFLYSLLEWVKSTKIPILFVGITTSLMFIETLEKRVRSRYQHTQLFYFENSVDHIIQVLLNRFDFLEDQLEVSRKITNQYRLLIKSTDFKNLLNSLKQLQYSISQYIYMFRLSFVNLKINNRIQVKYDLMSSIKDAVELMQPNSKIEIAKSLNYPEFNVLLSAYNLISHQKPAILFNDILQHINRHTTGFSTQKGGTTHSFSAQIHQRALDTLCRLNLMKLQDKNSQNLDTNEILLNIPLEDMKQLIRDLEKSDFPETVLHLAFDI